MVSKIFCVLTAMAVLGSTSGAGVQEAAEPARAAASAAGKPAEGKLVVDEKNYPSRTALAYADERLTMRKSSPWY